MKSKSQILCLAFLLLVSFCLSSGGASASSQVCRDCHKQSIQTLQTELTQVEEAFRNYRFIGSQIRKIYYVDLWQARRDSMDHLNKTKRKLGLQNAERFELLLKDLESKSSEEANSFHKMLNQIQSHDFDFTSCDPDPGFKICIQKSLTPISALCDELAKLFTAVIEGEREYTLAISKTAGGSQGLYPEDTLQSSGEHGDMYLQFESAYAQNRFDENLTFFNLLHRLRMQIDWEFSKPDCCSRLQTPSGPPVEIEEIVVKHAKN